MKTIRYEETEIIQVLDKETGKVKSEEFKRKSQRQVDNDEPYIKLFIKDICKLNDIPTAGNNILNELLKYINYENKVLLPMGVKKKIVEKLGISMGTLDNNITKLIKKDIIKREDTGIYIFNPFLFGRGDWSQIKEFRITWTYGKNGRALTGLEVERAINEDILSGVNNE